MKNLFFCFLLLTGLFGPGRPTQAQSWQWAVCPTGTGFSRTTQALAADAQGNTYVVGTTNGNVFFGPSIVLNNTGDWGFVGKLNAAGQWQWVTQVPLGSTLGEFLCQAAVADAAGNVYLTGSVRGGATFGSTVLQGGNSLFVAKIDPLGVWQWARLAAPNATFGFSNSMGLGLALDPTTGDPVVVGWMKAGSVFGSTVLAGAGISYTDGVVAGLSAQTGQWLWAKELASTNDDGLTGVSVDATGNVYVTGTVTNALTTPPVPAPPGTLTDVVVAKLAASTRVWLWATRFGGPALVDAGVAALPLPSGEVAVAGIFGLSMTLGGTVLTSVGRGGDIYVARLAGATGQVVPGSARQAGSASEEELNGVVADAAGNLLLSGSFKGNCQFGATTYPTGNSTATGFVARYLPATNAWAWVSTVSSGGNDAYVRGLALGAGGTAVYASGMAGQITQFGSLPPMRTPSTTAFVARLGLPLATRPAALGGQAVRLWPNPASGRCAVQVPALPGAPPVAATLLDGLGRPVRPFTLPSGTTTTLDLAGLPAGLYVLRLAAGAETTTALDLRGLPAGVYALRLAAGAETTTLRLAVE